MQDLKNIILTITRVIIIDVAVWFYTNLCLYKIIYQRLILGLREPQFSWTQPLIALILALLFSITLYFVPRFSIGKVLMGLSPKDLAMQPLIKKPYALFGIFLVLMTFICGLQITQFSFQEIFSSSGITGAQRIFTALISPNWNIFNDALFAIIETIYMAFISTALAIPIAFVISFFGARNLMINSRLGLLVYAIIRFTINITRSIEPLVWAIIFSVWVGIGPFAGMLALWLHSIAGLTKLYSEQIEAINQGPIEAMTATGAHPVQVVWYGVVPQIVLPFLSFTIYRWDINVRMATIIGLVGGGGIGTILMQYQGLGKWNEVGLLVLFIAITVWAMDYASARIREAIK